MFLKDNFIWNSFITEVCKKCSPTKRYVKNGKRTHSGFVRRFNV